MSFEAIMEATQVVFSNRFVQALVILLVIVLLQMVSNMVLAHIVRKVVPRHKFVDKEDEHKREETLISIFKTGIGVVIWTVGVLLILTQLGVNLAALATGAGLLGVVIGFGAQSTIKDFLAGLFIILENQYRVGDIITLNAGGTEVSGMVENISVRITRMRDLDGNLHIVQNGAATVVTNLSIGFANVNVDVGVSYHSDIDKVERVIKEVGLAMADDEKWKESVLEPIAFLRVDSFGPSAVMVKALGKVRPGTQWDVAGEFRRRLVRAFEREGIEIPLPQVVYRQADESRAGGQTPEAKLKKKEEAKNKEEAKHKD